MTMDEIRTAMKDQEVEISFPFNFITNNELILDEKTRTLESCWNENIGKRVLSIKQVKQWVPWK
jgi:hypothetical protein